MLRQSRLLFESLSAVPPTIPLHGALFSLGLTDLDGVWRRRVRAGREWWVLGERQLADPGVRGELAAAMRPIARDVFPHAAPSFIDLVVGEDGLARRSGVGVLCLPDGRIGGLLTFHTGEWGGERGFYAASAVVLPAEQQAGTTSQGYTILVRNEMLKAPRRPLYGLVRTPNPLVYESWRRGGVRFGTAVYPLPDAGIPGPVQRVCMGLAESLNFADQLDPQTMVVRGAYAGGIVPGGDGPYAERPQCGDSAINAMFNALGPEDAILVAGRVSTRQAVAHVSERTIRGGLRRVNLFAEPAEQRQHRSPQAQHPMRSRKPERRGSDRRASDRRAAERRAAERRSGRAELLDALGQPLPERRQQQRRAHERRAGDRRAGDRRAGADRRG